MSQAIRGATAPAPAVTRRKGFKAGLRERMRALGFGYGEAAAEVSRRCQVRPRQAYRLAWGWTLDQAAARFNELAASEGTDPDGRASMTGPHLCEVEAWPDSARRPSVYVLCLLAGVYETDVLCLLDLADHESLPQQDRLVLMRRLPAETLYGESFNPLARAYDAPFDEPRAVGDVMDLDTRRQLRKIRGRGPRRVSEIEAGLVLAGLNLAGRQQRPRAGRTATRPGAPPSAHPPEDPCPKEPQP